MSRPLLAAAALAALAFAVPASPAGAAAWCGVPAQADRPAVVGGPDIRVFYAYPSDGADASARHAPQIWADVEAIDAWWRAQDPTRAPRFDLAAFGCGFQVDLQVLRLPAGTDVLRPLASRFDLIGDAVDVVADARRTTVLVYYDGPVESADICGQGGGGGGRGGLTIVYLGACPGVSTVTTAAHELLHGFGAVPEPGPPNACPDDSAHVCDDDADIMWPYAEGYPLEQLLLDLNRDDYYGHAGTWDDVQDSPWLRRLDAQARLDVTVSGSGVVRSEAPGIACPAVCATDWDQGSAIVLRAEPTAGYRLARWGGACAGTGACVLRLAGPASVQAVFARVAYRLAVRVTGNGTVRSRPAGIACGRACAASFPSQQVVRLEATPSPGWRFVRWAGGCATAKRACTVRMTAASSVRALFARRG